MLKYDDVKNPKWMDYANTMIYLDVNWTHIPYETYSPCIVMDREGQFNEEHITELFNRAKAGDFGEVAAFIIPDDLDVDTTMLDFDIRRHRDNLLKQSDNFVVNDRWENYTDSEKQAWTAYRQALRDVPQNWTMVASYDTEKDMFKIPESFTFPSAPNAS